ncbi:MAG: hypothetical protein RLZZ370_458 [Bacteroidota bacterium]|jgi:cell division protein FtsN
MNAHEKSLIYFVEKLVRHHECVVVPGLGGFITRDHSASLNRFNGQLKPNSRTIFFNDILRQDDGILLNAMSSELGISYVEAQELVHGEVQDLLRRCASHEQQVFGILGSFYLNQHDKLFFLPSVTLNLSDISYGLKPVQLEAVVETLTREIRKPIPTQVISTPTTATTAAPISIAPEPEHTSKRTQLWKVAAAVAMLSLSTAAGIRITHFLKKDQQPALSTASIGPETPLNTPEPATTQKEEIKLEPQRTAASVKPELKQLVEAKGHYKVIAACFITEKAAIEELKRLATLGISANVGRPNSSALYRVIVGEAPTPQGAANYATKFTRAHKIRTRVELLRLP